MKHSLTNRILIGKIIGLIAAALAFGFFHFFALDLDIKFALGLFILYGLTGVLIGFMGMFTKHPVLNFPMAWWFRGSIVGLMTHALLVLFTYDQLTELLITMDFWGMYSPWWALLDGLILGLIMAYTETKLAGEGNLPLK